MATTETITNPRLASQEGVAARSAGARELALRLVRTEANYGTTLIRVMLALVIFPHGAQHALGWFGGYGFAGTLEWMSGTVGYPAALSALAIVTELVAPILLVVGIAGRLAALGIAGIMLGAIPTHLEAGFFMNWYGGLPAGAEGFEFHLLALAMAVAVVLGGSGAWSADRRIAARLDTDR